MTSSLFIRTIAGDRGLGRILSQQLLLNLLSKLSKLRRILRTLRDFPAEERARVLCLLYTSDAADE